MIEQVGPRAGMPGPGLPRRPRTVSIASGLWLALGVLWVLGGLAAFAEIGTGASGGDPIILVMAPLSVAVGALFLVLRRKFARGSDTRIALAVLGAIVLLFGFVGGPILLVFMVLLVVPALVLQCQRRSSQWFTALRQTAG
jgi:predicted branched-subunit amino acid permease